jgi:2-polyprenyl-3-methyl-5-hydroxy-6-metoxy-1,4-benzoquinol methylase
MPSNCPICKSPDTEPVTTLSLDVQGGDVQTPIHRCQACGCFWRAVPAVQNINTHWDFQSYTHLEREEQLRLARHDFFISLAKLALGALPESGAEKSRALDVGCSYGHLLQILLDMNCECVGVELVARLRDRLNKQTNKQTKRVMVYRDIHSMPVAERNFDVITLIDSLYYFQDPVSCLKELRTRVSESGVMIIRITNRTPLLKLYCLVSNKSISNQNFGDQLFAFSHRSMQSMFRQTGWRISAMRFFEHKKLLGRGLKGVLYNGFLPAMAILTRWKVSPGLTYVCRPVAGNV